MLTRTMTWLYIGSIKEVYQEAWETLVQVIVAQLFASQEIQGRHTKEKFIRTMDTSLKMNWYSRRKWVRSSSIGSIKFKLTSQVGTKRVRSNKRFVTEFYGKRVKLLANVLLSYKCLVTERMIKRSNVQKVDIWMFKSEYKTTDGHSLSHLTDTILIFARFSNFGKLSFKRHISTTSYITGVRAKGISQSGFKTKILVVQENSNNSVRFFQKLSFLEKHLRSHLDTEIIMSIERKMISSYYERELRHRFFHVVQRTPIMKTMRILSKNIFTDLSSEISARPSLTMRRFIFRIKHGARFEVAQENIHKKYAPEVYLKGVVLSNSYQDFHTFTTIRIWRHGKTSFAIENIHTIVLITKTNVIKTLTKVDLSFKKRYISQTRTHITTVALLHTSKRSLTTRMFDTRTAHGATMLQTKVFREYRLSLYQYQITFSNFEQGAVSIGTDDEIEKRHRVYTLHVHARNFILVVYLRFHDVVNKQIGLATVPKKEFAFVRKVFDEKRFKAIGELGRTVDRTVRFVSSDTHVSVITNIKQVLVDYKQITMKSTYKIIQSHEIIIYNRRTLTGTSAVRSTRSYVHSQLFERAKVFQQEIQNVARYVKSLAAIRTRETKQLEHLVTVQWRYGVVKKVNFEGTRHQVIVIIVYAARLVFRIEPRHTIKLEHVISQYMLIGQSHTQMISFKSDETSPRLLALKQAVRLEARYQAMFVVKQAYSSLRISVWKVLFSDKWLKLREYGWVTFREYEWEQIPHHVTTEKAKLLIRFQRRSTRQLRTAMSIGEYDSGPGIQKYTVRKFSHTVLSEKTFKGTIFVFQTITQGCTRITTRLLFSAILYKNVVKSSILKKIYSVQIKSASFINENPKHGLLLYDHDPTLLTYSRRLVRPVTRQISRGYILTTPLLNFGIHLTKINIFIHNDFVGIDHHGGKKFTASAIYLTTYEYAYYDYINYRRKLTIQRSITRERHVVTLLQKRKTTFSSIRPFYRHHTTTVALQRTKLVINKRTRLTPSTEKGGLVQPCGETEISPSEISKYIVSTILIKIIQKTRTIVKQWELEVVRTQSTTQGIITVRTLSSCEEHLFLALKKKSLEFHDVSIHFQLKLIPFATIKLHLEVTDDVFHHQFAHGDSNTGKRIEVSAVFVNWYENGWYHYTVQKQTVIVQRSKVIDRINFTITQSRTTTLSAIVPSNVHQSKNLSTRSYKVLVHESVLPSSSVHKGGVVVIRYCLGESTSKVNLYIVSTILDNKTQRTYADIKRKFTFISRQGSVVGNGITRRSFFYRTGTSNLINKETALETYHKQINFKRTLTPTKPIQFYIAPVNGIYANQFVKGSLHKVLQLEVVAVYTQLFGLGYHNLIAPKSTITIQKSNTNGGVLIVLFQSISTKSSRLSPTSLSHFASLRHRSYKVLIHRSKVLSPGVSKGGVVQACTSTGTDTQQVRQYIVSSILVKQIWKLHYKILQKIATTCKQDYRLSKRAHFRILSYRRDGASFLVQRKLFLPHQQMMHVKLKIKLTKPVQYYVTGRQGVIFDETTSNKGRDAKRFVWSGTIPQKSVMKWSRDIKTTSPALIPSSISWTRQCSMYIALKHRYSKPLQMTAVWVFEAIRHKFHSHKVRRPAIQNSVSSNSPWQFQRNTCSSEASALKSLTSAKIKIIFRKGSYRFIFGILPKVFQSSRVTNNLRFHSFRWFKHTHITLGTSKMYKKATIKVHIGWIMKQSPKLQFYAGSNNIWTTQDKISSAPRFTKKYTTTFYVYTGASLGYESLKAVSPVLLLGRLSSTQARVLKLVRSYRDSRTMSVMFERVWSSFFRKRTNNRLFLVRKLALTILNPGKEQTVNQLKLCFSLTNKEMRIKKFYTEEVRQRISATPIHKERAVSTASIGKFNFSVTDNHPLKLWARAHHHSLPVKSKEDVRPALPRRGASIYKIHLPAAKEISFYIRAEFRPYSFSKGTSSVPRSCTTSSILPYVLLDSGEHLQQRRTPEVKPLAPYLQVAKMAVFGEVRSLINVTYTSFDRDAYGGKLLRMTYIKQHSVMTVEPKVAVSDGRLNVDQQTCQASPKHTTHKVSLASSFDNFCRLSRRLRDNLSKHSKDHWKKDSPHMQNLKIVGMNLDKKQVQCEVDSARYQIISTKNTDNRIKASAETEWGPTILYDYICRTSYLYTSVVDAMKLEHNNIIAKPQVIRLPANFKPQNSISTKTSEFRPYSFSKGTSSVPRSCTTSSILPYVLLDSGEHLQQRRTPEVKPLAPYLQVAQMAVFGEVRSLINVAYTSFDRDAYGGKLLRMTYIKQHSVMTVEPKVAVSDGRLNVDQQTCQASPKHTTHKVSLASSFDNFCRLSRRLRDNLSKHSKDHWKTDSPHMQNLKIVGMNMDKKQVQCEGDSARYQIISTKNTDNRIKASAETEWGPTILYDYICRTSYLYTSVVDAMKLEHNNIIAKSQVFRLPATFKPQNSISTKTSEFRPYSFSKGTSSVPRSCTTSSILPYVLLDSGEHLQQRITPEVKPLTPYLQVAKMAVFGEVRSLINVAYTSFDRDAYGGKLLRMTYIKQHSVMTVEPKVAVSDGRLNVDQQTCQAPPKHTTHKVSLASSFDDFCRLSRRLRDNLSKHSKDHWKKDSPYMQNFKIVGMNLERKQVQCEVDSARYQIISTKNYIDNRMKASAETEWGPTILYDYVCRTSYLYTSVVDAMKLEHNNIIAKPQVTGLPATFKPQNSISTKTSTVPYLVESCGTSISYVYERSVSAEMAEILYLPSYDDTGDYKICEESWFIEAVPHLQHAMIHIKSRIPKSKTH